MIDMRKYAFWLFFLFLVFLVLLSWTRWPRALATQNGHEEVCFCHNVNHNPHTICTDNQGQINGHNGHVNNGTDTAGECPVPTATPTPTLTPTPTPTPTPTVTSTPTPTPPDECEEQCEPTPTPTPTETPRVTPTPTPTPVTTSNNPPPGPAQPPPPLLCVSPLSAPIVAEVGRIDSDTVWLSWHRSTDPVQKQHVLYGYSPDALDYSLRDLSGDDHYAELNAVHTGHVWVQVWAIFEGCVSQSAVVDP